MTDINALLQRPVQELAWKGQWARVWLRPDVFSAQEYIVGAVAIDAIGVHEFRVLTGPERFGCIYGDSAKPMFERLLADLRAVLAVARASRVPLKELPLPDMFRVEMAGGLRTKLPGENLDRMLRDGTVPLEPDEPLGRKLRFSTRSSSEIVEEVLNMVRLRAGFSANEFIREDYFGDQSHQVGVNLVTRRAAGIVASGWYAGVDRIQLEFLLAATRVDAYAAAKKKEAAALFFMRPSVSDGLTQAVWNEVQERLGDLEWQLERKGARVVTHDNADQLAREVVEWAKACA